MTTLRKQPLLPTVVYLTVFFHLIAIIFKDTTWGLLGDIATVAAPAIGFLYWLKKIRTQIEIPYFIQRDADHKVDHLACEFHCKNGNTTLYYAYLICYENGRYYPADLEHISPPIELIGGKKESRSLFQVREGIIGKIIKRTGEIEEVKLKPEVHDPKKIVGLIFRGVKKKKFYTKNFPKTAKRDLLIRRLQLGYDRFWEIKSQQHV